MSGPLRQIIGPTKTRLAEYIDNVTDPRPLLDPSQSHEQNLQRLNDLKYNSQFEKDRIEKAIHLLDRKNSEWSKYIQQLSGNDKKQEDDLYSTFSSGTDGFIGIWNKAEEKISLLCTLEAEIISDLKQGMNMANYDGANDTTMTMQPTMQPGNHSQQSHNNSQVKLPKLQLLNYYGDPLKWPDFWDSYEATIHTQNISNVQKFNYLKTIVKGRAFEAIEGISVNNANYIVAIETLKKRFGDRSIIKTTLYNNLRNLQPVSNFRINELRTLVDSMDKIFRQLEAQGEDLEHQSLTSLILEKLPAQVIIKLEEQYKNHEESIWSVETLRDALSKLVTVQESVFRMTKTALNKSSQQPQQANRFAPQGRPYGRPPQSNGPHSTTESFAVSMSRTNQPNSHQMNSSNSQRTAPPRNFRSGQVGKQISPCILCQGVHYNDSCPNYATREARQKRLMELNRCFICLKIGCRAQRCQEPKRKCFHCQKFGQHSRMLCPNLFLSTHSRPQSSQKAFSSSSNTNNSSGKQPIQSTRNLHLQATAVEPEVSDAKPEAIQQLSVSYSGKKLNKSAFLLTATAHVANPDKESEPIKARIFFDCGSERSFVATKLVRKLQLEPSKDEALSLHTFASQKPCVVQSSQVQFNLFLQTGTFIPIQANALPILTGPIQKGELQSEDVQVLKRIPEKYFAESAPFCEESFVPDILLGLDYFWDLIDPDGKQQLPSGLYLLKSKLGLILGGRYNHPGVHVNASHAHTIFLSGVQSNQPTPNVEEFWSLETIGIMDSPSVTDDDKALDQFNSTIQFHDNRYHVQWPWKSESPDLPDNYGLALGRFKSLTRRFKEDPSLLKKYDAIIQDQRQKGIVEPILPDTPTGQRQHYLPHHPVITPQKTTTKVRIVYDASARQSAKHKSLNDCLYRGPVILPDLCGLLMRFRLHPIALVSDVEKAFLQIGLQDDDKDVTRFFWFRDPNNPEIENNLQIYRFCRVTFGVISSPFLLSGTVKYHLHKNGSPLALQIANNVYVDNVVIGAESVHDAQNIYSEAKELFQDASLNLCEWCSNSTEFLQSIPEQDKTTPKKMKVLGLLWDVKEDKLKIAPSKHIDEFLCYPTKRQVLNMVASHFDPLGFLAPSTLLGKTLIQKLWKEKVQWDDQIPEKFQSEWNNVVETFQTIPKFSQSRFLGKNLQTTKNNIVVFVDASSTAYAASVYIRIEDNQNGDPDVTTQLLFAKSRLAPKGVTLPRLELLAIVIGVRAAHFVKNQLQVPTQSTILFSDSECALQWLTSRKPLSVFVENRIKEIKSYQAVTFRYVTSHDNPADCASRGIACTELLKHSLWWNGPLWLRTPQEEWPKGNIPVITPQILLKIESEEKHSRSFHQTKALALPQATSATPIVQLERFSSLKNLLKTVTFVLRFLKKFLWNKLSTTTQQKFASIDTLLKNVSLSGPTKGSDVTTAKFLLERWTQQSHFTDLLDALDQQKRHPMIVQLGVQKDTKGLLRCHGRLSKAELNTDAKFPKLLPSNSRFTNLLIQHVHDKCHHAGTQQTLATIRQEYWIPKGRISVRKILSKCVICKRVQGGPYELPSMPPLPEDRVSQTRPFQNVGLDYFGPLLVKMGTEKVKIWVCLFTCLATRAIHLEPTQDMSSQQFLNCLCRFIACHGKPNKII